MTTASSGPLAGIRVVELNGIGPGPALPSPRQSEEQFRAQCESTPLHRGTSPQEVARALPGSARRVLLRLRGGGLGRAAGRRSAAAALAGQSPASAGGAGDDRRDEEQK